ncbi:hypothetical protein DFP74_1906 [Nocardiopsis sp. Huas11]|uniref:hypothetical protein n=1 Tax=Nocardiopsis sp. Huas11 TaxID=2183912 RepID=UPI000EB0B443|nr:hypothetical protein [Nocardiopsis sp. Huas11]RKS06278.1 hypothetical protein DFP74_1906 [Nocardiopsis sp. Huas11]
MVVFDGGTGELLGEYQSQESGDGGWARYLTDEVRVSYPGDGHLGVSAESLDTGEQAWEFEWEAPEGTSDFTQGSVSLTPDAVVVSGAHRDDSADTPGQGDDVGQVMVAVGLDPGTGELLWGRELPFAAGEVVPPVHTVSSGGEVLLLEAGTDSPGEQEQWLLDPATGEDVEGSAFPPDPDRDRVALLDDGYVDREVAAGQNEARYRRVAFDGTEQSTAVGGLRAGETSIDPGTVTREGVLRLDFLSEPDLDRGPVSTEFLEWGGQGPASSVDIDLAVNEELLLNTEGSMTAEADAPKLVTVPGAVIATEATEMSKKAVALA